MWPFDRPKNNPAPQYTQIQDAVDELGLVQMNQLNKAIENALKKHLDPMNLEDFADDQGGYFQPEFDLVTTAARMKAVYRREPWVNVTANIIAKTLATIPYDIIDKSTGEIDNNHPLNEVMKISNSLQDNFQLEWAGDLDLVLSGNFFRVILDSQIYQVPIEYVTMRTSNTEAEFKKFGPIMGIEIRSMDSATALENQFIPWSNVIHHKLPNPFNPFVGLSMIAAASRPILLDRHKNEFEMAFYLRGATHSGVIETTEDVTKERMRRLMTTFESAFTGRRNWFRQLWLPKNAKWVNSGLTMAEMQHLEGLRENRLTLLAVIGVPPQKVGIVQDVNRSTAEQQDKTFYENTIIPLAKLIAAGWNNSYLVKKGFDNEVEVRPNFDGIEAIEGGILTRAERARALDNIATLNEQREVAGLSPLKSTDPRGNMLQVELTSLGFAGSISVPDEDMGPEDQPVGDLRIVEVGPGDGENDHTHMAEVDDLGNGSTTSTSGDGPDHEHEILNGEVQISGVDGHSHPSIETEDDEKSFRRIKAAAVENQENIESSQSKKFMGAYQKHLFIKLEQAKKALRNNIDVRGALEETQSLRLAQYRANAIPVLVQTQERGFNFAQRQTRSMQARKKQFDFSPQDELAIEIIQDSTRTEKNRLLELRGIEHFLGIDATENNNVMNIISDGLEEGNTTEQIAKTLEQKYGERYGDQAFTIARTETLFAISDGVNWQKETLEVVFTDVRKQWFHVGDVGRNPDAREVHASFEKEGVKGVVPGDYVWINEQTGASLRYPRDPNAGPQDVINCFVEDTKIESHGIKNAFKRFYRGDLVTVYMANGKSFTGTPNHPILTSIGWVPLGKLNKSHKLFKADIGNNGVFSPDINVCTGPTAIGQIYDSLLKSGDLMRVSGGIMDFHGDGVNSDVEIVFENSLLMNSGNAVMSKTVNDVNFTGSSFRERTLFSNSGFNKPISRVFSSQGSVSTTNLINPLFGSHLGPFDRFSFRPTAPSQTKFFPSSIDGNTTYSKHFRQFFNAKSFVNVEMVPISNVVVRKNQSTHVFNISTENELYTAEGFITHNCRCSIVNIIPKNADSNASEIINSQ